MFLMNIKTLECSFAFSTMFDFISFVFVMLENNDFLGELFCEFPNHYYHTNHVIFDAFILD